MYNLYCNVHSNGKSQDKGFFSLKNYAPIMFLKLQKNRIAVMDL